MHLETLRGRQVALALVALVAAMAAAVAHAASGPRAPGPAWIRDAQPQAQRVPVRPTLVVPDVTRSAFVFAKGTLSDAGFAWRVVGSVAGYPSSLVVSQSPAPGTRVVDTGAPAVVVQLRRNPGYPPAGTPENVPPYRATSTQPAH